MAGPYAIAGALLILAGCTATPEVTRPVRAVLILAGTLAALGAIIGSVVAATLE